MTITITPVESGWLSSETAVLCEGGTGDITIPVCTWLIEHPRGRVLFDTGMHEALVDGSERLGAMASIFEVTMQQGLGESLTAREIDPAGIDYVVFSHLHFDHSGGTHAIPNARLIVQADEWQAGFDEVMIERGVYLPADFDLGHDVLQVKGEHDIFGDGSVVCIPTPGHTAGHQSLRVELESGPVLLVADCCYWSSMLENNQLPPFAFNADQQRESMQLLRDLQLKGVRLLFGHDIDQWREVSTTTLR